MPPEDLDSTRRQLEKWRINPPVDSALTDQVLQRMRQSTAASPPRSTFGDWLNQFWQRPLYAGGLALLSISVGGVLAVLTNPFGNSSIDPELPAGYRLVIDPLYRLDQANQPAEASWQFSVGAVNESLSWLREELDLTSEQYVKLESLHQEFGPTFASIFQDLQLRESEVQNFEIMRRESELIDFLQVYRVRNDYRQLQQRASSSTAELVERVSQLVNTKQRQRYFELLKIGPRQSTRLNDSGTTRV